MFIECNVAGSKYKGPGGSNVGRILIRTSDIMTVIELPEIQGTKIETKTGTVTVIESFEDVRTYINSSLRQKKD